ncbi:proP [Symbiodinium sp. CCMP2456]|nr:proP [Symbiodinium sp. CCMP2456]
MGAAAEVCEVVRIYWPLLLGNVLEWYEFAIFSFLEPYFQTNFFHDSAISTWLGFACTFAARPFGGLFIGLLGDVFGRKVSAFVSIFGMLFGTVGQGMVPSYRCGDFAGHVGWVLLIALRILQGVATGGEIAAVSTYITEVGSQRVLARSMALLGITCSVGVFLAQLASYLVVSVSGEEAASEWAWRLPFITAIIPGLISARGRQDMPESKIFLDQNTRKSAGLDTAAGSLRGVAGRLHAVLKSHSAALTLGTLSVAGTAMLSYGGYAWGLVYLEKHGATQASLILAGTIGRAAAILLAPLVGWLADMRGVAWNQFFGSCMLALAGIPFFLAIVRSPDVFEVVVFAFGLGYGVLLAFNSMVLPLHVVELFPASVRHVGVGTSYNVGMCLFGGFAPALFELSLKVSPLFPGVLLSLSGCIPALAILVSLRLQARGLLCLPHIRPAPYFGRLKPCKECQTDLSFVVDA